MIEVHRFRSTAELTRWLEVHDERIRKMTKYGPQIQIVTNRYREGDGNERAWERVCEVIYEMKLRIPLLVYCGNPSAVDGEGWMAKISMYVTDKEQVMKDFCLFEYGCPR